MTVSVSNTDLNHSFNTWRLNTNFAATVLSNNVVTVWREGSANRGGLATGNGHIIGTMSATELKATVLAGGNTIHDKGLIIGSNTTIGGSGYGEMEMVINANTTINGNIAFNTSGGRTLDLGDITTLRITGSGAPMGSYLRITNTNNLDFEPLTLRQITDMSSNSAHLIMSASNTTFSDNGDTPMIVFASNNASQKAYLYMTSNSSLTDGSDVILELSGTAANNTLKVVNASNSEVFAVRADGTVFAVGNVTMSGVTTDSHILPINDDSVDLGAPNREFRNAYFDGNVTTDVVTVATGASQGVGSSLIPVTDALGNLGSSTRKWGTVWADNTNGGHGVFKTLGVSGNLTANGNQNVLGNLVVTGTAQMGDETIVGQLNVGENIVVTGNAEIGVEMTVQEQAQFNANVILGGASSDVITVKGTFANQSTTGVASFNDRVYIGNATTDKVRILSKVDSNLIPVNNDGTGHYNLGTTSERWNNTYANNAYANNIYIDNDATVAGDLTISGTLTVPSGGAIAAPSGTYTTLTVTGTSNLNGTVNLGDNAVDNINVNGSINSDILPVSGERHNIGSNSQRFHYIYANNVVVGDEITITNKTYITKNLEVDANTDIAGTLSNDGVTMFGKNAKLHANNTIAAGHIRNVHLQNDGYTVGANNGSDIAFALGESLDIVSGTATGITTTLSANTLTISGLDASYTVKGVSKFNSSSFSVVGGAVDLKSGGIATAKIANTMNSNNKKGSSTKIPVISVNKQGQVIGISDATVAGVTSTTYTQSNNNFRIAVADGTTYDEVIAPATTTSGTGRGVASFDSGDFSLSSGHVSLKNATSGAVLAINGTTNEVEVSRTNGTVTVGLPNDVTISGQLNVSENIVVAGNLTVSGTTTTVNTETINLADNIIKLNSNYAGSTPTEDGGIEVERGTQSNRYLIWDESGSRWAFTNDGSNYYNIPISTEYDDYGSWTISDHDNDTYTIGSGQTLKLSEGSGIDVNWDGARNLKITNTDRGSSQAIFKTFTVDDTDTEYTWTNTGSAVADSNSDTLTFVGGDAIDIDVDSTNDAIRVELSHLGFEDLTDPNADRIAFWDDSAGAFKWLTVGSNLTLSGTTLTADAQSVTAGAGIDVTAGVVSVEPDLRDGLTHVGYDNSDYIQFGNNSYIDFYVNSSQNMRLEADGDLHVERNIYSHSSTTSSDRKLKGNIKNVENALDKVTQLNGVEFDWKKTGDRGAGVIAQDVLEVLPQAVVEVDGLNGEESYLTVQYDALHALLIESIKELKAEIDELKANK